MDVEPCSTSWGQEYSTKVGRTLPDELLRLDRPRLIALELRRNSAKEFVLVELAGEQIRQKRVNLFTRFSEHRIGDCIRFGGIRLFRLRCGGADAFGRCRLTTGT